MVSCLERELERALEDTGRLRACDSSEAAGSAVHVCAGIVEVGVVEHVECLKPKRHL